MGHAPSKGILGFVAEGLDEDKDDQDGPEPLPDLEIILEPANQQTASHRPAETASQRPAETASQRLAETASQRLAETASRRLAETASQRLAETASQRLAETASQRPAETASQRLAEPASQRPAETASQRSAETASQRPAETASQRSAETASQRLAEPATLGQRASQVTPSRTRSVCWEEDAAAFFKAKMERREGVKRSVRLPPAAQDLFAGREMLPPSSRLRWRGGRG